MTRRALKAGDRIVYDEDGRCGTLLFISRYWAVFDSDSADQHAVEYPNDHPYLRRATKRDERNAMLLDIQENGD